MRRHHAIVAHTAATAVFIILAGLALAPYLYGTVTPFYGFIAGPALFLGALAGAARLDDWLTSKACRENSAAAEDAWGIASVSGIAVPRAWASHASWRQYVRNSGCVAVRALLPEAHGRTCRLPQKLPPSERRLPVARREIEDNGATQVCRCCGIPKQRKGFAISARCGIVRVFAGNFLGKVFTANRDVAA